MLTLNSYWPEIVQLSYEVVIIVMHQFLYFLYIKLNEMDLSVVCLVIIRILWPIWSVLYYSF